MSNNDNTLAYISDQNGINNIYLKNGENASQPITNVLLRLSGKCRANTKGMLRVFEQMQREC